MPKPRHGKKSYARKPSPQPAAAAEARKVPVAAPPAAVPREAPAAPAPKRPVKTSPAVTVQHPYLAKDLIRVGVITGIVIAVLVVLALLVS